MMAVTPAALDPMPLQSTPTVKRIDRAPGVAFEDVTNVVNSAHKQTSSNAQTPAASKPAVATPPAPSGMPEVFRAALLLAAHRIQKSKVSVHDPDSLDLVAKCIAAVSSTLPPSEAAEVKVIAAQAAKLRNSAHTALNEKYPDMDTRKQLQFVPFAFAFAHIGRCLAQLPATPASMTIDGAPILADHVQSDVTTQPAVAVIQRLVAEEQCAGTAKSDSELEVPDIRKSLFTLMARIIHWQQQGNTSRNNRVTAMWLDVVSSMAAKGLPPESTVFDFFNLIPLDVLQHRIRTALMHQRVSALKVGNKEVNIHEYEVARVLKRTLGDFAGQLYYTFTTEFGDFRIQFSGVTRKVHLAYVKDGTLHLLHREIKNGVAPKKFLDKTMLDLGSAPAEHTLKLDSKGLPQEAELEKMIQWRSRLMRELKKPLYYADGKDVASVVVPESTATNILRRYAPDTLDGSDDDTSSSDSDSSDSSGCSDPRKQTADAASPPAAKLARLQKKSDITAPAPPPEVSSDKRSSAQSDEVSPATSGRKRKPAPAGERIGRPRASKRQNMMIFRNSFMRATEASLIRLARSKVTPITESDVMLCVQDTAVFEAYASNKCVKDLCGGDDDDRAALRVAELVVTEDGGVYPLIRLRNAGLFRDNTARLGECENSDALPRPPPLDAGGVSVTRLARAVHAKDVGFFWHPDSSGWDPSIAWLKSCHDGLDESCVVVALSPVLDNPRKPPHFPPATLAHTAMPLEASSSSEEESESDSGEQDTGDD